MDLPRQWRSNNSITNIMISMVMKGKDFKMAHESGAMPFMLIMKKLIFDKH